jgi:hypothetical protein
MTEHSSPFPFRPLILVHTAHPQAIEHSGDGFGRLLSPRQYARAVDTGASGIPWAADNDCFERPIRGSWERTDPTGKAQRNAERFRSMLRAITDVPGCRFIAAPDRVEERQTTTRLFEEWLPELQTTGQPIAYVLQDCHDNPHGYNYLIPWDDIGALFIGGSTEFKLGWSAERSVREAKKRGLWVHMGRVNSRKRFDYARAIGCDSIDGTKFSRWRNTWLPGALRWHKDHLQERIAA